MNHRHFSPLLRLAVILAGAVASASGQTYNGHGYGFFGMDAPNGGSLLNLMSTGGGAEVFVYKGLAVGGDLAFMFPREYPSDWVGLFSVNPAFHFVNRQRPGRVVPFVTGGYTLGFRNGTANLMNWGGGITGWMTQHVGLRTEARIYEYIGTRPQHYSAGVRLGLQFR